jgi:hypothetical protein
MNTALGARHQSELPPLFTDLPARVRLRGWLPGGWLSPGWASSLVSRVLGGFPGRARASEPAPSRGLTREFPGTPGAPGLRYPGETGESRDVRVLPFPRGAGKTFSIGRDHDSDLAIDDLTVSRYHARLERGQDGWVLADLGSTNGTRVNGWLVRDRVAVQAGDLVRFGDTEYKLSGGAVAGDMVISGTGDDTVIIGGADDTSVGGSAGGGSALRDGALGGGDLGEGERA